jgi:hypothetical protein
VPRLKLLMMMVMICLLPQAAAAFSRIVVMAPDADSVTLDGVRQNSISGRTVIHPVSEGTHRLAVLGADGAVLHQESLDIPDGVQVRVRWSKGGSFAVTGATSAGQEEAADSHELDSATGVKTAKRALGRAPDGGTTSRGTLGPAGGSRPSDFIPQSTSGSRPTTARDAASQTLRSMTYGAQAGTSFGSGGRTFNQKIKKPNVVYGTVHFIKSRGPACRIYSDGALVAELGAGKSSVEAGLEAGRRQLEFRDLEDHTLWHSGDLRLGADHNIQLVFDDASSPRPQARPWLWQGL